MDPHELETIFTRGRFHPVFFIILKELFDEKGPVFILKHFSKSLLKSFRDCFILQLGWKLAYKYAILSSFQW